MKLFFNCIIAFLIITIGRAVNDNSFTFGFFMGIIYIVLVGLIDNWFERGEK